MESLTEQEDKCSPKAVIADKPPENPFKKPILFGKIGRLPKKLTPNADESTDSSEINGSISQKIEAIKYEQNVKPKQSNDQAPAQHLTENPVLLPYKEPDWSGLPESNGRDYIFEVLKNGVIIETVNLMAKPFWIFGRHANCDVCMQHPTISRYHAVLQYRRGPSKATGFYIYDLGSTHGTFLNKNRLQPNAYRRIQVGHMLKLGCSTRSYILSGPEYDEEAESELSITELKQKRHEELLRREAEKSKTKTELEEKKKREEERGVDWGLGEDADEETDLSENPYAQTNNEELYLDDPKKALRGFFEREGLNLEYDCNEQGIGQFLCRVELPVDDEIGRPIVAEVLHKGKKKEAVIQCALEACRILDRYGVLRQATHESRKKRAKNWEENDYYDSDEDTFLDRTGTIEKKRAKRMNTKAAQKVETYESLIEQEKSISKRMSELESQLASYRTKAAANDRESDEKDSLDKFMERLEDKQTDKRAASNLKSELARLRTEHANVVRLANIAKPANLPALREHVPSTSSATDSKKSIVTNETIKVFNNSDVEEEEEEDEPEDEDKLMKEIKEENRENVNREWFSKLEENTDTSNDNNEPAKVEDDELAEKTDERTKIEEENDDARNRTASEQHRPSTSEEKLSDNKKKKKNQRRIHQKQEKVAQERQRGYVEDAARENYCMWVPPVDQAGDGKTNLNDKYGY